MKQAAATPLRRWRFLLLACFLNAGLACAAQAAAAWQPSRNVEIVVSTSPGSGSDTTARFVQKLLTEKKLVDVPLSIMNKPGGGGTIGLTYLTQHTGNGHYLLVTSPSLLALHIMGRTSISHIDVTPLAQLGAEPVVFTVRADSDMTDARALAARLKSRPESLSFSIGTTIGSHNHIAVAQLSKAVGVNPKLVKVVAFSGSADGVVALLGGHIAVVASPVSAVWEHATAGKLRMIAIAAERRHSGPLAEVPTWKELGYPVLSSNWRSIVAPKGLDDECVRYWDSVLSKLAHLPEWKQSVDSEHMVNTYSDSRATRELMDAQYKLMRSALADLGLTKSP